jgi:hypothetical protein
VTSVSPRSGSTRAYLGTAVSAFFSGPMSAASISASTVVLRDSTGTPVPASVSYNSPSAAVVLTPAAELTPSSKYTATIRGGASGVLNYAGKAMPADIVWSFTTGTPPAPSGPGGPILVISTASNPFTTYYGEILLAEGLNEFTIADLASVNASTLANYDLVILGDMRLTPADVTMFTNWVHGGGNLIAMHPDKQLAGLLQLTATPSTLTNGYLAVNVSTGPGVGIVAQPIQFHGTADLYTLEGASSYATLYSNASKGTASPAVTLATSGSGEAAAFTYDLARSVVYTRQGNPGWARQARDGQSGPIRPDNLFFGAASFDPQSDWVDRAKIAIPQADEQQRLLANLIIQMNRAKKPLPRFWYFPKTLQAVVVMTGDDHGSFYTGSATTARRFNDFIAASPAGCSVANWQCVRATAYLFPQSIAANPLTNSQAAAYVAQGFEIGAHVDSSPDCTNWNLSELQGQYTRFLSSLATQYPSIPAPRTNRMHCIGWSDYDSQPLAELQHGIRLDTSYYYWPPAWVNDTPGMFTGSGIPMRYTDRSGNIVDVYQATTQMTDESGQSYPLHINALLDNALGTAGYYGAFVVNAHNDQASYPGIAPAVVRSAQLHGVPVVSAQQLLTWVDGRNTSFFGSLSRSGNIVSFTIAVGAGARNLTAMLPIESATGSLAAVTLNDAPVSYQVQTVKGVRYAFFAAIAGTYRASYGKS